MGSVVVILVLVLGVIAYCELTIPGSRTRNWIWCKKYGLKLKEYTSAIGGGVVFWCGVDDYGDEYVPDERGTPRKLERKDTKCQAKT